MSPLSNIPFMKPLESQASADEVRLIDTSRVSESPDPAEQVRRVLAGDAEAFRCLVEAYERAVFGLCRRLLYGNATDAEDLTQETFLRAYENLERLEDKSRFAPWLFQIARSLCRDRRRRLEIESRALVERGEAMRRSLLLRDTEDEESGNVPSALEDLPPEERTALDLRYFHGLSYEEIGRKLSMSFSQVDHLIRKARARLSRRYLVRQRVES